MYYIDHPLDVNTFEYSQNEEDVGYLVRLEGHVCHSHVSEFDAAVQRNVKDQYTDQD